MFVPLCRIWLFYIIFYSVGQTRTSISPFSNIYTLYTCFEKKMVKWIQRVVWYILHWWSLVFSSLVFFSGILKISYMLYSGFRTITLKMERKKLRLVCWHLLSRRKNHLVLRCYQQKKLRQQVALSIVNIKKVKEKRFFSQ